MIQALYIHVPFCHTICPFCAFAVHGNRPRLHGPYLAALRREMELRAAAHAGLLAPLTSVYIGGGTPSALPPEALETLLSSLRRHFPFDPGAEIAIEMNPEDAAADTFAAWKELGINRVSLGLQSLDDATLRALGRNNGAAAGKEAWEQLRAHGPGNHNLDLMFGAPGIGGTPFRRDVEWAVGQGAPHVSLYGLDVEPGTPFARDGAVREWAAAGEEAQADDYLWAAAFMTARGYRHYEVSNFCLPGREGRQNLIVWDGGEYLGLGPGASSFAGGVRWSNARHLRAWMGRLEQGEAPTAQQERLSPAQLADEDLMLALRRDSGLDIAGWSERHAMSWDRRREALAAGLVREGKARLEGGRLVLTAQGFLLADGITAALAAGD